MESNYEIFLIKTFLTISKTVGHVLGESEEKNKDDTSNGYIITSIIYHTLV